MKPILFTESPRCPQEPRPPRLGWRLNAGLKTLLRGTSALGGACFTWWQADPISFNLLLAVVPPRYVYLTAGLLVASGFIHNWANHAKAQ